MQMVMETFVPRPTRVPSSTTILRSGYIPWAYERKTRMDYSCFVFAFFVSKLSLKNLSAGFIERVIIISANCKGFLRCLSAKFRNFCLHLAEARVTPKREFSVYNFSMVCMYTVHVGLSLRILRKINLCSYKIIWEHFGWNDPWKWTRNFAFCHKDL